MAIPPHRRGPRAGRHPGGGTRPPPARPRPAPARARRRPIRPAPARRPARPRPRRSPTIPLTGLPPLPPGTPGPTITVPTPGELQAEVPFAGSAQGAIHYALAQPRGLAVTLPNARSVLPIGRHVLGNEGFRYVWIREPERGGIQVRFMFAERTPVLRALEVDEGVVRVRVAPLPPESQ